jgi:hypothetical protein
MSEFEPFYDRLAQRLRLSATQSPNAPVSKVLISATGNLSGRGVLRGAEYLYGCSIWTAN